jgi:hypothetical protein
MTSRKSKAADDFWIEKTRLPLALSLVGGEQLRGSIFVQPSAYRHLGREEPSDVFNAAEPFFPMLLDDGEEVVLIAKDRVIEVAGISIGDDSGRRPTGVPMALVQVVLSGGETRIGSIRLEIDMAGPRVLDFLNHCTDRFLPLYMADGIRLINRSLVDRISPLE